MGAGTVQLQTSKRNRRTKRVRPMSEINVTPFVDVMLVLLIIFMVTAPMLTVGIPIELPKTAANALPSEMMYLVELQFRQIRKLFYKKQLFLMSN